MSTRTIDDVEMAPAPNDVVADPFDLDITFIENTPVSETLLMCSTGDNCGTSCGSACITS